MHMHTKYTYLVFPIFHVFRYVAHVEDTKSCPETMYSDMLNISSGADSVPEYDTFHLELRPKVHYFGRLQSIHL